MNLSENSGISPKSISLLSLFYIDDQKPIKIATDMDGRRVLAFIGLALLLVGFCLPWIQPSIDMLSGLEIAWLMFKRPGGLRWDTLPTFLILIPLFAVLATWVFSNPRRFYPLILIALADLVLVGERYIMTPYLDHAFYGFYILLAGLITLNIAVLSLYVKFS